MGWVKKNLLLKPRKSVGVSVNEEGKRSVPGRKRKGRKWGG